MRRCVLLGGSFLGLAHPNSTTPIAPKAEAPWQEYSTFSPSWPRAALNQFGMKDDVLQTTSVRRRCWEHWVPYWMGQDWMGWDGMALKPLCCQQRDIPCSVTVLPGSLLSWSMLCSKEWGLEQNLRQIFEQQHPRSTPLHPHAGEEHNHTPRAWLCCSSPQLGAAFALNPDLGHQTPPKSTPNPTPAQWQMPARSFAGSDRPSPVFEGLGDLGVAPLDEPVLAAGTGRPLAFVP